MNKSVKVFFIILAIAFVTTNYMEQYKEQRVTDIIDGDTIKIGYNSIRLIGIDAPETNEQCYEEAKEMLEDLVKHELVRLEKDTKDKDDYGRLLRYVYVNDILVNKEMVRLGLAKFNEMQPNTKYSEIILEAENNAKNAGRCLWE
ncbi:MAG: thermonuclease family protein [Candidatus Aenigmatarchaeota archaeon]